MARVVGIDPGTVSFDLCGLDGDRLILDRSIPTADLARDPGPLVRCLREAAPLDLVAGPSGYGLPLVRADALTERDVRLAALARRGDESGILGFRRCLEALRDAGCPVVFTPGAIHLPTVPAHRKVNRVDLGTADKVCAAALAVWDQATRCGVEPVRTSFLLVELGGAFTAVLAVEGGRVVDGLGGSSGPLGYRAAGALDGEVAYLLGAMPKAALFTGGAAYVAGDPGLDPEALGGRVDERARNARAAFVEGVAKAVAALRVAVPEPREVLLSGRLARVGWVREALEPVLARVAPVREVRGFARVAKAAAQGAALLADGLAGGRHRALVEAMAIEEASGTALDHLYVEGADRIRAEFA